MPANIADPVPVGSDSFIGGRSIILDNEFGYLYFVPRSLKSPQIELFLNNLKSFSKTIFATPADIRIWYNQIMDKAGLINMHEYFCDQVTFKLHPLCDADFHRQYHRRMGTPDLFSMKNVDENVSYLEYTSPSTIIIPSNAKY
jgi:hypothetical protein